MKTFTGTTRPLFGGLLATLLLALLLALSIGCGEKPADPKTGPSTITTVQLADLVGFNELLVPATPIHTGVLNYGLFLPLLEEQANYQSGPPTMKPRLAESWEFSEDRKTLTFKLRPGLVWSDGEPITSADVVFTFEAQKTPEMGWQNAESKDRIEKVEALDPLTARFTFSEAYSTQLLDANEGIILPKHAWSKIPFAEWRENADFFNKNLVTSGPFKVESWQPQQRLVLTRNERYFEPGLPKVDRVVFNVVPDEASHVALLRSGAADIIELVPYPNLDAVKQDPNLVLLLHEPRTYFYIGWNVTRSFLGEKEVRQALTMAIDRQNIVDSLLFGYGKVACSPYPSSFWVRNKDIKPWPFDPQRAKELLASRGFKDTDGDGILERDGKRFEIELLAPAENLLRRNIALLAQEQLKNIGVAVTPRVIEFNAMIEPLQKHEFDAMVGGLAISTNLSLFHTFHTNGKDSFNWGLYSNPEVDHLIETIDAAIDPRTVKAEFDQLQLLLHEEQPVTFTYESQRLGAANKRVKNIDPNALSFFFNLRNWELVDSP